MNIVEQAVQCQDVAFLLDREWLETNGLGGYAASTLLTCHTRRYHGLLVANLPAPAAGRHVLLSKFDEAIGGEHGFTPLTIDHFPGVRYSANPCPLVHFDLSEYPTWTYRVGHAEVRRSVVMVYGQNTVLLRYVAYGTSERLILRLRPLVAYRRHHTLTHENGFLRVVTEPLANGFRMEPYRGMPPLVVQWSPGRLKEADRSAYWYRNFELDEDRKRGYDWHEDLFMPTTLELELRPEEELFVLASTDVVADIGELWNQEVARRQKAREGALRHCHSLGLEAEFTAIAERLVLAADQFLITTPSGRPALLAGYPWFEDWGRDTMISLPGTAFHAGHRESGFAVLEAFASLEQRGLLPNFINPDGTAAYNSVDASLWFFWTVQQFLNAGGELERVRQTCWPAMRRIIAAYVRGMASPPVKMNSDGLLYAGSRETQLTWMDANANGLPVTPRWGYAVEINALWFNALVFAGELATLLRDDTFRLPIDTGTLAHAYRDLFWLRDSGYLADVVNEEGKDVSVRPNQIFAVSLPFSPLTRTMQEAVVDRIARELLTPYGLRTLGPEDSRYCGRYTGTMAERDSAYHQGTVWPWLMGAFVEAYLRVHHNSRPALDSVRIWLRNWSVHLADAGVGTISEILDGDAPHRPNGCIAQAWSVGEVLRAMHLYGAADKKNRWWSVRKRPPSSSRRKVGSPPDPAGA